MKDISKNLLPLSATMRDVLNALNKGIGGVVLMVDESRVLRGIFTDGDVRRALLEGAAMEDSASRYMNQRFTAGRADLSRQENVALLNERIRHLPILDEEGRPTELLSWAEYWRLPVMEPSLGGNELKYVSDCIASGWISSKGEYVKRFEAAFAEYLGVPYALSTTSGTTALHLALLALDIGAGDEVIVPDLTFAASANVVLHCGAKPVLADVDRYTWTLDTADVQRKLTPRTKAIMPVHLYGHPTDMLPIIEIAQARGIAIIEDCAEALGAEYRGRKVGTLGDVAAFSFFANKIITTGEGGMVTTTDPNLYEKMHILRSHGMKENKRYWHLYAGYNYRMTNIQAAIGLAQLERIDDFLTYRERIVATYNEHLRSIPGIILPPDADWAKNIYWLYSIVVDESVTGITRDLLAQRLEERGIETRPFFYPLHVQPAYLAYADDSRYPNTDWLAERGLSLPTANDIKLEDVIRVCEAIRQIITDNQLIHQHLSD